MSSVIKHDYKASLEPEIYEDSENQADFMQGRYIPPETTNYNQA